MRGNSKEFPEEKYEMIPVQTGMTYSEARALEQSLITAYTLDALENAINSIAPTKWGRFQKEFERIESLIECYYDD